MPSRNILPNICLHIIINDIKIWLHAIQPHTLTISISPVIVGALFISFWDYHLCTNSNDYNLGAATVSISGCIGADNSVIVEA